MDRARIDATAGTLFALLGTGAQRGGFPGLDMAEAYAVGERIRELRRARGERPVGRKIGFTNTTIWDRYGVDAPMWSHVYDTTLTRAVDAAALDPTGLPEPRIEPEVALRLGRAPRPGMDADALLDCVASAAAAFEVVQSVYPGWRMTGAEACAAFGLHGRLFLGPEQPVGPDRAAWAAALARFMVTLRRDGAEVDAGRARNVLGGPIAALGFLVEEIARHGGPPLAAGEIITTGVLTDAWPIAPGETWEMAFSGIALPGFRLEIVAPPGDLGGPAG